MTRTGAFMLFLASLTCSFRLDAQVRSPLQRVDLRLDSLADSGSYLVYAYRIVNARNSQGGMAILYLDVSAPRGTGFPTLPATGRFYHGAGFPHVELTRFRDHIPIGPISPTSWMAFLTRDATLDWGGSSGGFEGDVESIAPGDSLGGFALRSPYLPGWTVGPTYAPGKVTLRVMDALLTRVCGELAWIDQAPVCDSLHAKLNEAAQVRGDRDDARRALRALLDELEAQHGFGKAVSDNAYWLLKTNGEYLLAHL